MPDDSDTWGSQNDGLSHLPPWRQNSVSEVPVSSLLSTLAACGAAAWVSPVPCHLLGGPVEYGTQGAAREWGALFAGNPNLFLLTVSLRYSLHTTKFSYFKYTIQSSCATINTIQFRNLSLSPRSNLVPICRPFLCSTQPLLYFLSIFLLFLDISYIWNRTIHVFEFHPSQHVIVLYSFRAELYPIVCICRILFIHPPVNGHLVVSTFWLLMSLGTLVYKSLDGFMCSFLWWILFHSSEFNSEYIVV